MGKNILVTGGAGYIGGSVLRSLLSRTSGPFKASHISTAVRSTEQVQSLSKLGIDAIQLDLNNESAVKEAVLGKEIDIVVHTAGCVIPGFVLNSLKALGQRRVASGNETYFIHTSVAALFSEDGGWPYGEVKDSDPIFERQKQIQGPNPVREINTLLIEQAKVHGVHAFNIPLPHVYGRGTGESKKLSVSIPAFVRTSIKQQTVHKFERNGNPPATHISDLTELYTLLVEKILQNETIPSGEHGYYFAVAHKHHWWDVMDRLAEILYSRGLVTEPKAQIWPSYEIAADSLGWPLQIIKAMGVSSGQLVPVNAHRLGWQSKWDEKRFLDSLEEEVNDALELDTQDATLFDTLLKTNKD